MSIPAAADSIAVANRLRPVLLRLNRRLRRELRDLQVTGTQVSIMAGIRQNPGIGLTELANREEVSTAALCTHIDRLESSGLVERSRTNDADRRRIGLSLTSAGLELLDTVRSRRTMWLAQGLDELEPEDLAAIDAAIEPMLRLLQARS